VAAQCGGGRHHEQRAQHGARPTRRERQAGERQREPQHAEVDRLQQRLAVLEQVLAPARGERQVVERHRQRPLGEPGRVLRPVGLGALAERGAGGALAQHECRQPLRGGQPEAERHGQRQPREAYSPGARHRALVGAQRHRHERRGRAHQEGLGRAGQQRRRQRTREPQWSARRAEAQRGQGRPREPGARGQQVGHVDQREQGVAAGPAHGRQCGRRARQAEAASEDEQAEPGEAEVERRRQRDRDRRRQQQREPGRRVEHLGDAQRQQRLAKRRERVPQRPCPFREAAPQHLGATVEKRLQVALEQRAAAEQRFAQRERRQRQRGRQRRHPFADDSGHSQPLSRAMRAASMRLEAPSLPMASER
jgi:hypothetical protein